MGRDATANPLVQWKAQGGGNPGAVYDAYGREIREGDVVMVPSLGTIMWRVQEIAPDLSPHPEVPLELSRHLYIMTLVAVHRPIVIGGRPDTDLVKVRDAGEFAPTDQGEGKTLIEFPGEAPRG